MNVTLMSMMMDDGRRSAVDDVCVYAECMCVYAELI